MSETLNTNKAVQTRDGRAAIILSTNDRRTMGGYEYPIRAKAEHPNEPGNWVEWGYMSDGRWKSNEPDSGNDLINIVSQ